MWLPTAVRKPQNPSRNRSLETWVTFSSLSSEWKWGWLTRPLALHTLYLSCRWLTSNHRRNPSSHMLNRAEFIFICQLFYRSIPHPAELICLPQGKSMWYIFSYIKKKARKVSGLALNSNKCTWAQSVSFPCKNEGLVPGGFLFIAWCLADHHAARSFPAVNPRVIASSHFTQPPKYCGMELCPRRRS